MLTITAPAGFEAEKAYACTVLMGELLGVPWRLQFSPGERHYRVVLPNGRTLLIEDGFWKHLRSGEHYCQGIYLPAQAVLMPSPFDRGRNIVGVYGNSAFITGEREWYCGVDIVASTFFMLTRWEEAVSPERDAFGRFPAYASLAYRAGFLHRPIVNEYARFLRQVFARLGLLLPPARSTARLHLSCDVDHPRLWWSPVDRFRTLASSLLRRKNPRETLWWLRHGFFRRGDPFDVFDAWMGKAEQKGLTWHFNFLGDPRGRADAHYSLQHPSVKRLLGRIAERGHIIGFHPSRRACGDPAVFEQELSTLRQAAPTPVTTGRQHYLCFSIPDTWQQWADAGMKWDSTLGYPEAEGFRCGICCDFPVFNIRSRQVLPLREKPLIAMDITLAHYRRYTPEQALTRLQSLWQTVREHGGELVLLWHNSSWHDYFWKDWQPVLETCWREWIG